LDAAARAELFDSLVSNFSPDPLEVGRAGDAYRIAPSADNLARLLRVVEPRRQELFRRLNLAPEGTRGLVEMRAQLLDDLGANPDWRPIEADLSHLLTSWFNRGFLSLRQIDWSASANILDKLIHYEAVHQIQGWDDLRRRLEADRRCYAFFHPALPDDPIIFIEVALTRGISDKVQPLLDPSTPVLDAESADSAVFYSITNCQKGLRGVPLGSFLIKQVVKDLSRQLPHIKTFATLSPVPGFRKWLIDGLESMQDNPDFATLRHSLSRLDSSNWFENNRVSLELQRDLVPLCAHYLLEAKQHKEPRDSVARFHLRNGARLERINWLADTSSMGMQRSAGLMTNYVYRLAEVERNHELYSREFKITSSRAIEMLAKRFSNGSIITSRKSG
jgi:malonyl-CoA decarboxylase